METNGRFAAAGARVGALAITLACAFATAVALLAAFSSSFWDALSLFFLGPFENSYYFGNMLNASIPLILAGLGASVAFGSRNFNLGGEGQIYSGAIAAAATCLALPDGLATGAPLLGMAVAAVAGAVAGAFLGALSGALKRSLGVDELISSFLASAAVVYLGDFLITGPLQDPASNFQATRAIPEALRLARMYPPSSLSAGCFLALAAALCMHFVMRRTRFGFELGLCGKNREFARYVGVDAGAYDLWPMALSGALHGLAGAAMILGTYYKAMKGFSSGIGWSAIAVALIAGDAPLAVVPAGLFFAYLEAGAKAVMVGADVSSEIVAVIQSVIFFLVTARALRGLFGPRLRGLPPRLGVRGSSRIRGGAR
jgi:simple sugar transport system permease protein